MKIRSLMVFVFGLFAAALLPAQLAPLNEHIAVSSTAAPDYRRESTGPEGFRPETYVFTPGKFFESATKESGMESIRFADLTKVLAPNLARQKYYPTKDAASADLVIVVHWGESLIYEDPQKDSNMDALNVALPAYNAGIADQGYTDPAPLNNVGDSAAWAHENAEAAIQRNAVLLGYARDLGKSGLAGGLLTEKIKTLRAELSEERYFVVLMAYDYQSLKKDKTPKLRWVTRLSVRTPGNNFAEALPVLSQAGSHVFGRQLDEMVHLKANLREGRVSLGELQYLGFDVEAAAERKPQ